MSNSAVTGPVRLSWPFTDRRQSVEPTGAIGRRLRDVGRLELHLLRNFRKYAYGQKSTDSIWHWLALGQHRGLPTRLLDWTYSPLVALHFATASLSVEQDGCVWMLNFVEANRVLPPG